MDWRVANNEQNQSLESILARRDSSSRLLAQLAQEVAQKQTSDKRIALDEEVRKGQLARQVKQDAVTAEDRDESRKVAQQGRDLMTVKQIAPGTRLTAPEDIERVKSVGLGSRLKEEFKREGLPNGDVGPVQGSTGIPDGMTFEGTADQLDAQTKNEAATQRIDETQRYHDMVNALQEQLAQHRMTAAQAQNELGLLKLEMAREKMNMPKPAGKTPDQIREEHKAAAEGTLAGKGGPAAGKSSPGMELLKGVFGGKPQATPAAAGAPKVGDVKTFPNGSKGVFDGQGWVAQ